MTACTTTQSCLFSENNMPIVDGRPRFVLGLYENPKDDATLQEAIEAGFNLFQCSANKKELDRLRKFGAYAWINLGANLDLSIDAEKRRKELLKTVNQFKEHPALLIWEGPDEALWNHWWGAICVFNDTEYKAMKAVVDERSDDKEALEKLLVHVMELKNRALWDEFEAARNEFWRRTGKQPVPSRPIARFHDAYQRSRRTGDGLTAGIKSVRQADTNHIIWLNHAPRNSMANLRFYNRAADMAGCDIYPIPSNLDHSDLVNVWPSSVGDYTDRMRRAAPGRACAMVLQGFGWRDILHPAPEGWVSKDFGRRPDFEELRFMVYNAISHGANVIMYWGTFAIEKDSQMWRDMLQLARQLRMLEPALLARPVKPAPYAVSEETYGSVDAQGPHLLLKKVDADYVLLVSNEIIHGLAFTVEALPKSLDGKTLYRLGTDESVVVKNRSFRDGIKGFDVHVYATSRRFEPKGE